MDKNGKVHTLTILQSALPSACVTLHDTTLSIYTENGLYTITCELDPELTDVSVAVRGAQDDQNDLIRYDMTKISEHEWSCTVDLTKPNGLDVYHIHIYAGCGDANREMVAHTDILILPENKSIDRRQRHINKSFLL